MSHVCVWAFIPQLSEIISQLDQQDDANEDDDTGEESQVLHIPLTIVYPT
jgi:hypothetical protein